MPKKRFFVEHETLIEAAIKLNYLKHKKGICRGFTLTYIEAFLTKNTAGFLARIMKINQDLDGLLAAEQALQDIDMRLELLDIKAFYESVLLYQDARLISKILGEKIFQNDIEKISSIASSDAILNADEYAGLKQTPIWEYANFDHDTVHHLLMALKEKIQASSYQHPIPFLIDLIANDKSHSICIIYNPFDSTWQSIDINYFPPRLPEVCITKAIVDLPFKHYEAFSIRAIFPTKLFPQELVDQMLQTSALSDSIYCLSLAIDDRNLAAVKSLLSKKINPNTRIKLGNTMLHYASYTGCPEIIEQLLQHDANINAINIDGRTPLHLAVHQNRPDIVAQLLQHGADMDAKNNQGHTALHLAVYQNHHKIVEKLLQHGADMDARNNHGETALHLAVDRQKHRMIKQLLAYGANPNVLNHQGYSSLHCAANLQDIEVVKDLLAVPDLDKNSSFYAKPQFLFQLAAAITCMDKEIDYKLEQYIRHYQRANVVTSHIEITPKTMSSIIRQ